MPKTVSAPSGPLASSRLSRVAAAPAFIVCGILLVGFNLRPALTSVGPLLHDIGTSLGLSNIWLSVLTTAPVICLGLFGPLAPALARRFGAEQVIAGSLGTVTLGIGLRGFGLLPLFAGTLLIGAGMCLLGVLAPSLVKREFPHRLGPMMGFYTMLISAGAAVSTASAVPIARALGGSWVGALLVWALPCAFAMLVWLPLAARRADGDVRQPPRVEGLWSKPLAWQVTGFLAVVAGLAYAVFSWGPTMLVARGLDPVAAGVIVSLSYLAQMVTGLFAPLVAGRLRDQRALAVAVNSLTIVGLTGYVFAPAWSLPLFSIVLGLGQGSAFGLALSLIVLRAGNATVAAQLSGMAQSVGYVVGALVGPFCVGLLHDWTGSWPAVLVFYAGNVALAIALGLGAGRARTVDAAAG